MYSQPLLIAYSVLIISLGSVAGLSIVIARARRKDWLSVALVPVMAALFVCFGLAAPFLAVRAAHYYATMFGVRL